MSKSVASVGFTEEEFNELVKQPAVKKLLSELAKERYPSQHKMVLNCLQAGVSLGLELARRHATEQINAAECPSDAAHE